MLVTKSEKAGLSTGVEERFRQILSANGPTLPRLAASYARGPSDRDDFVSGNRFSDLESIAELPKARPGDPVERHVTLGMRAMRREVELGRRDSNSDKQIQSLSLELNDL